jgi:integrase
MASCKKDAKGRKLGKGESYRSDGRYCYSYTICGERKWLYASDLAELRELERRIEHDKDDGIRTQEASKITLNDMFETYIATKTKLKTSTRENYLYLWNKYIRPTPLAHQSLINIKTSDIKKLYGELLANGFRTNSLDSINNLVHPTLEMAVDDDLIRKNPSKGVYRALKEKDCKKRVALTLAQQQAFLNYVNQSPVYHHWTPIFVTLLGTGMRIAECVGLTRKDIDFENELISVNHNLLYRKIDGKCRFLISTPKTASSIRFIPMCPEVLAELAGLIAILDTLYDTPSPTIDGYTDFIFRNRYGDLLNPHSLNRAIERIIRDYNAEELKLAEEDQRPPLLLPHFSVHSLRHTFCTRMFEVESNHKAIQTIMGHAEISTTLDIYTHITEDTLKNSVQNMSAKIKLFG